MPCTRSVSKRFRRMQRPERRAQIVRTLTIQPDGSGIEKRMLENNIPEYTYVECSIAPERKVVLHDEKIVRTRTNGRIILRIRNSANNRGRLERLLCENVILPKKVKDGRVSCFQHIRNEMLKWKRSAGTYSIPVSRLKSGSLAEFASLSWVLSCEGTWNGSSVGSGWSKKARAEEGIRRKDCARKEKERNWTLVDGKWVR